MQAEDISVSRSNANLDILRAIAVSLVFFDHLLETTVSQVGGSFHPYDWYMGRMGVLLFFVHTSFVLMHSMQRLQLRGFALMRSFMIRRVFRLFPLSILCIAIVQAMRVPTHPWESFIWMGWPNLASNLALTTNLTQSEPVLAPLWTLPVELQMYVVLPLLYLLLKGSSARTAFTIWILAVCAAMLLPILSGRLNTAYFAPCFVAGALGFRFRRAPDLRIDGRLWLPFLILAMTVYVWIEGIFPDVHHRPSQWLFCLVIGLSIARFAQSPLISANRIGEEIAKYSYGIYLFHFVGLWLVFYVWRQLPLIVKVPACIAVTAAMSVASFHLLERPAISFGARLAARRTRPQPD